MSVKLKIIFHDETWPYLGGEDVNLGIEETGCVYYPIPEGDTVASWQDLMDLPGVKDIEVITD